MSSGYPNDSVARSFFVRIGIPTWQEMSLAEQLTVPKKYRRVVSWLLASQRMQPTAAYLAVARPWVGVIGRHVHADFYARFTAVADEVGFTERSMNLQWAAVMKVAALQGVPPQRTDPRTPARRAGRTRRRDQGTLPGRERTHLDHRRTVRSRGHPVPRRHARDAAEPARDCGQCRPPRSGGRTSPPD